MVPFRRLTLNGPEATEQMRSPMSFEEFLTRRRQPPVEGPLRSLPEGDASAQWAA
jgi:hypothetical protein